MERRQATKHRFLRPRRQAAPTRKLAKEPPSSMATPGVCSAVVLAMFLKHAAYSPHLVLRGTRAVVLGSGCGLVGLKRILEETREADGESDIREKMQALRLQLSDSIHNLHEVFSSRIFVAVCRGLWDRLDQIVLTFLESRKEKRVWSRASDYALGILDDVFASEMQKLLGNALQDKDLDPPRSAIDARSILC